MTAPVQSRIGEIVGGRYRLISPLGEGGFGIAYRAWDNLAGVPVALKMPLARHLLRPTVIERFEREAARLKECCHPHIVPIIDDGRDENGLPYVVMRFLPGGSLADHRKPASASSLHTWLPSIADALDYAHLQGILHRDVKPSNIFLDANNGAYLGDFGIAKVVEHQDDRIDHAGVSLTANHAASDSLTKTGSLLGTLVYMAPECFEDRVHLTGQADQYSLAVAVFEMLSGKHPVTGDSDRLRLFHGSLQSPTLLAQWVRGLPGSLVAAVSQSLAKDPNARFPSCAEFAKAALAEISILPGDSSNRRFLCPACSRLIRTSRDCAGKYIRCAGCQSRLKVTAGAESIWREEELLVVSGTTNAPAANNRVPRLATEPDYDIDRESSDQESADADRVQAANMYLRAGDFSTASRLLREVIANAPSKYILEFVHDRHLYVKFWEEADFLHFVELLQEWQKAPGKNPLEDIFDDVLWLRSAYPAACHMLAGIEVELQRYDEALALLDQGEAMEPTNMRFPLERALIYSLLDRKTDAWNMYTEALDKGPGMHAPPRLAAQAGRGMAFLAVELGHLDDAERLLRESLKLDPDSACAKEELQVIERLREGGQLPKASLRVDMPNLRTCPDCGNRRRWGKKSGSAQGGQVWVCDRCHARPSMPSDPPKDKAWWQLWK